MKEQFRKLLLIGGLIISSIMPAQANDTFSYTVLNLPSAPRVDGPWLKVINEQQDWESYFYSTTAAITYPQGQAPIAPVIDFERYQLLSGGLGVRSIGGYSLAVESVHELEEKLLVHVFDVRPGSTCLVTFGFTNPSMTILVKKTDKPIKVSVTEITQQCAE